MDRRNFLKNAGLALATITTTSIPDLYFSELSKLSPFPFTRVKYASGNWDVDPELASVFYDFIQKHSPLRTESKEYEISLDSKELLAMPFAFITGNHEFSLNNREREVFRQFVYEGGFVFVDDCNHDTKGSFAVSFEAEMKKTFGSDHPLEILETDSEIYHSYFRFPEGPPTTAQELNGWGDKTVHNYLKAIKIDGNIGVLYSNKDFGCEWTDSQVSASQIQFAVNLAVYPVNRKLNRKVDFPQKT
ncbi:MAG: DUF4159 domain-containing protein [Pyrinomonadaceae bacterium]